LNITHSKRKFTSKLIYTYFICLIFFLINLKADIAITIGQYQEILTNSADNETLHHRINEHLYLQ